jgi:hypothetical protein
MEKKINKNFHSRRGQWAGTETCPTDTCNMQTCNVMALAGGVGGAKP